MRSILSIFAIFALYLPGIVLAGTVHPGVEQVDAQVGKHTAWLKDAKRCPASLMPQKVVTDYMMGDTCDLNPGMCLLKCEAGKAKSCYWLAYAVQAGGGRETSVEALFQRACKLGVVSGCTNRAAKMSAAAAGDESVQRCAVRTYRETCAHSEPWGCTLYALHLTRGIGVKQDLKLAQRMLKRSCAYGKDDPACANAKQLEQEIHDRQQAAGGKK